jgi:hypothetical protein
MGFRDARFAGFALQVFNGGDMAVFHEVAAHPTKPGA